MALEDFVHFRARSGSPMAPQQLSSRQREAQAAKISLTATNKPSKLLQPDSVTSDEGASDYHTEMSIGEVAQYADEHAKIAKITQRPARHAIGQLPQNDSSGPRNLQALNRLSTQGQSAGVHVPRHTVSWSQTPDISQQERAYASKYHQNHTGMPGVDGINVQDGEHNEGEDDADDDDEDEEEEDDDDDEEEEEEEEEEEGNEDTHPVDYDPTIRLDPQFGDIDSPLHGRHQTRSNNSPANLHEQQYFQSYATQTNGYNHPFHTHGEFGRDTSTETNRGVHLQYSNKTMSQPDHLRKTMIQNSKHHFRSASPGLVQHQSLHYSQQQQPLPETARKRKQVSIGLTETKNYTPEHETLSKIGHQKQAHDDELDHSSVDLRQMSFSDLNNESFDVDPHGSGPPEGLVEGTLIERLDKGKLSTPHVQKQFFDSLAAKEWDEAGDWFLDQFHEIMEKMRNSRARKRRTAAEFEQQVSDRYNAIEARRDRTEEVLAEMKKKSAVVLQP